MDKPKGGLAILIGHALAKKGKAQHDPIEDDSEDSAGPSEEEAMQHLKEISQELIEAVKNEDADSVASLLREAFECCDAMPHVEGPHEEGGDSGSY